MIVCMHELLCADCGIPFAITKDFEERRRQDGKNFYCPVGHVNCYRDSEIDKLRRERDRLKQQQFRIEEERDEASARAAKAEAAQVRLKRRIGRGTCPCCKRTFTNVQRHMAHKHPEIATLPARTA